MSGLTMTGLTMTGLMIYPRTKTATVGVLGVRMWGAMIRAVIISIIGLNTLPAAEPALVWELGPTGTKASLRALSAPNEQVIWAAGSGGTIIRSDDSGSSWQNCNPEGYESVEFRALHAWDERHACAASAGTPAVILNTNNAGEDWQVAYQNAAPEAFFDGLKFWDAEHGVAFSDPVAGAWLVLESADRGLSWRELPSESLPAMVAGEAAFAASNSAMCVGANGAIWIGTGGAVRDRSRILYRPSTAAAWRTALCPLPSNASSGVFSILRADANRLLAVGGDYRPEVASQATAAVSLDGGATWQLAEVQPASFRSALAALPTQLGAPAGSTKPTHAFIATGPTGTDVSVNGLRWEAVSDVGFHALATVGQTVFAVGSNGRFAKLSRVQEGR